LASFRKMATPAGRVLQGKPPIPAPKESGRGWHASGAGMILLSKAHCARRPPRTFGARARQPRRVVAGGMIPGLRRFRSLRRGY